MFNFASLTLGELAPILTIYVGMLGGFYTLLKFVLSQAEKTSDADRQERQQLAGAIEKMADPEINGNKAIADGITRQAQESAERNGHLAELAIKGQELSAKNDLAILKAIKNIPLTQEIKEQNVNKQTVQTERVERKEVSSEEHPGF